MTDHAVSPARRGPLNLAARAALALLVLCLPAAASATVVAEGIYTISSPERRSIPFRMVLTPTGARDARIRPHDPWRLSQQTRPQRR
jgi:hypothetical protein